MVGVSRGAALSVESRVMSVNVSFAIRASCVHPAPDRVCAMQVAVRLRPAMTGAICRARPVSESTSVKWVSERRGLLGPLRKPRSENELLIARLIVLFAFTIVFDLVVSLAFFQLERDALDTEIRTYGDALFWTSSQITTVSSSLRNPLTTGGRILAVVTDFIAVATVSLLFGTIAQHIHVTGPKRAKRFRRSEDDDDHSSSG